MKSLLIANWKMNPQTMDEAKALFEIVRKNIENNQSAEIIICPPFVFLSTLSKYFKTNPSVGKKNIFLGAQNCFWEEKGAYTGEISSPMLKNLGCSYVIVGHSERRQFLNETDEMINKKIKDCLKAHLKPIFCVGEKEGEDMGFIVEDQLKQGLKDISNNQVENVVIAYEPVWAIGTGKPCSPDDAMRAFLFIKKILAQLFQRNTAEKIRILYGGSVDSKNANDYLKKIGMDGLLVGGASLNASEFLRIVNRVESAGL